MVAQLSYAGVLFSDWEGSSSLEQVILQSRRMLPACECWDCASGRLGVVLQARQDALHSQISQLV